MTNIKKENSMIRKSLRELTLLDRFLFDIAMGIPEIAHNIFIHYHGRGIAGDQYRDQ